MDCLSLPPSPVYHSRCTSRGQRPGPETWWPWAPTLRLQNGDLTPGRSLRLPHESQPASPPTGGEAHLPGLPASTLLGGWLPSLRAQLPLTARWSGFLASDWALSLPIPSETDLLLTESLRRGLARLPSSFIQRKPVDSALGRTSPSGQHYTGPPESLANPVPHSVPGSLSRLGALGEQRLYATRILIPKA